MSHLGINGNTAVVAHMLVSAGKGIEKRCLSAVGVTHKGNVDLLVFVGKR